MMRFGGELHDLLHELNISAVQPNFQRLQTVLVEAEYLFTKFDSYVRHISHRFDVVSDFQLGG